MLIANIQLRKCECVSCLLGYARLLKTRLILSFDYLTPLFFPTSLTNRRLFQALSTIQKTLVQAQFLSKGLICVKNNPLTLDDINTFKMLKMPDGEHAKCFAACLFKNIGIVSTRIVNYGRKIGNSDQKSLES